MKIEERARQYCDEGPQLGQIVERDGKPGILFLDEGEFIPFNDLGYSNKIGFFRISQFPAFRSDREGEGH